MANKRLTAAVDCGAERLPSKDDCLPPPPNSRFLEKNENAEFLAIMSLSVHTLIRAGGSAINVHIICGLLGEPDLVIKPLA